MGKLIKPIIISILVLIFFYNSYADSPITSTVFHTAYSDLSIVKIAERAGIIDKEIAEYLLSTKNSIDKKAAVCNALSWSIDGKNNAELFSGFLAKKYKTSKEDLNYDDLSADEMLCLGYLKVLDNYFEPKPALAILEKAKIKNPDSYTINIIYALIQSQIYLDENKWCKVWKVCNVVRNNNLFEQDLRDEAVNAIFEYIDIYQAECR